MTVKPEDDWDWETVLATSVVVSGPHEGRPYKSEDFLVGLEDVLEGKVGDHVLAFGPLKNNQEWHLTLNNLKFNCSLQGLSLPRATNLESGSHITDVLPPESTGFHPLRPAPPF